VNIIIVHPRGVVFPEGFRFTGGKTTSQGWTIIMFTLSAGINSFIILKRHFFFASLLFRLINTNISVNEQPECFHVLDHRHFTDIPITLVI
jgi:hypothetical protein